MAGLVAVAAGAVMPNVGQPQEHFFIEDRLGGGRRRRP